MHFFLFIIVAISKGVATGYKTFFYPVNNFVHRINEFNGNL